MSEAFYVGGSYLESNPTWHVEDSAWKARNCLRMLQRNGVEPETVAEVGCGAGEVLRSLQDGLAPGTRLVGYDIAPEAIALAQARANDRLAFVCRDLLAERDSFDLVLCLDVFEHVDDYLGFLRRLSGRGRWTLFHIPLNLSVQTVLRSKPILRGREKLGHIHYFTAETALATLADTGFRPVDWFYTQGSIDLPGKSLATRALSVPRRLFHRVAPHLTVRVLGGYSLLVLAE